MEIEVNKKPKNTSAFNCFSVGSVIKYDNRYWIIADDDSTVVNLANGEIEKLKDYEQVEFIKAKLVITED